MKVVLPARVRHLKGRDALLALEVGDEVVVHSGGVVTVVQVESLVDLEDRLRELKG